MIAIVHAAVFEGRILLWGETPVSGKAPPAGRGRRRPKVPRSTLFPFDPGIGGLFSALKSAGTGFKFEKKRARPMTAWLPARGGRSVPSSPLVEAPARLRMKPKLSPWTVTAYPLSTEETVEFLCAGMDRRTLAPGVVVGHDLACWAEALGFAGSIVARQQYLPGLTIDGNGRRACWEPVFAGADREWLAGLAKKMPPAARALCGPESATPPETPAVTILKRFVGASVDYLVRSAVQGDAGRTRGRPGKKPVFDSAHDHWLDALRARDGAMEDAGTGVERLAGQVREWRRPVMLSSASPFRLCFRLEEPETIEKTAKKTAPRRAAAPADAWYVRYLLQASDDPSLLVPVRDAWKSRGRKVLALKRLGLNIREFFLSTLGQAAGICPRVEASLETAEPAGYELDAAGAHEFLTQKAPALEQTGFGVMLPAWWTRKGAKRRLTVRANVKSPGMRGAGGLSLDAIVRFDWEAALGGKKLTVRELESLARLKEPLVKVRGQWVEMSAGDTQTALELWKKKVLGKATVRDIVRMALGAKDAAGGLEFDGVAATGWIGDLLERIEGAAAFEELPAPEGFAGTLRPYQLRGYSCGCRSCGGGVWARCWPTTWGSAKPFKRWRLSSATRRRAASGRFSWSAPPPW